MRIEAKRFFNSKFYLIVLGICMLSYILGYFLLVTIDHTQVNSIMLLFESTYTVFTQFGMLIFSPLIIYQFSSDYKEKNVIFYKSAGFSALSYYLCKIATLILSFTFSIIIVSFLVCCLFRDFSIFHIMFLYFEAVIICYIIEIGIWAFLFKNFVISFFVNFMTWIMLIVLSSFGGIMSFASYYDASSPLYDNLTRYLDNKPCIDVISYFGKSIIYDICVFILSIIIIIIFSRKWEENGV